MESLVAMTDFLAAKGGWGVAVVIGYAYWKKDREYGKEAKDWMAYAIETTEVLASLREIIKKCHRKGNTDD